MILRIASILVAGFVVLGALMPHRGLQVVLRGAGLPPLTVTLEDGTGLLRFVGPGPSNELIIGAVAVPGDPNAVVIGWLGGRCDAAARIGIAQDKDQIHVHRSTTVSSDACVLEGIGRSIVIEFREPVDPASIVDTSDWLLSGG